MTSLKLRQGKACCLEIDRRRGGVAALCYERAAGGVCIAIERYGFAFVFIQMEMGSGRKDRCRGEGGVWKT